MAATPSRKVSRWELRKLDLKFALVRFEDLIRKPEAQGLPGRFDSERRRRGYLLRSARWRARSLAPWSTSFICEADRNGLLAINAAPRMTEEIRSLLFTYQARQREAQAKAGVKAKAQEVGAETRFLAGDAKIRHHGKSQAGADCRAAYSAATMGFLVRNNRTSPGGRTVMDRARRHCRKRRRNQRRHRRC